MKPKERSTIRRGTLNSTVLFHSSGHENTIYSVDRALGRKAAGYLGRNYDTRSISHLLTILHLFHALDPGVRAKLYRTFEEEDGRRSADD